ncbi:hypothetical protein [Paenibacillus sp. sgz302251]|uniref:hypothetical protein n=1 Tax=Paenibacillus sp. sgz302251 TaxID=3414493 RepID=UPI003C7A381F
MLAKKIIISALIFTLLLLTGGILDHHIREKRAHRQLMKPYNYSIYSSHKAVHSSDRFTSFMPREYVRIVRKE